MANEYLYGAYGHIGETVAQSAVQAGTTPVYIGTAPVNLVRGFADAGVINEPVKLSNMIDAQKKLGYSADWGTYTLCEVMDAHFNNPNGNIGPIYVINVLNPSEGLHRMEAETSKLLRFTGGRAEFASSSIILDTLRIQRPDAVITPQVVKARPAGPAGKNPAFDYAAAYEAAGVKFTDNGIFYAPTEDSVIAPEIVHEGKAYVGVLIPKPEGATKVSSKINGEAGDTDVDLTKDGEFVLGGEYVTYFSFANEDGTPLDAESWSLSLEWTVGSGKVTTECSVGRGHGNHYIEGEDYAVDYNFTKGTVIISSLKADEKLTGTLTVTFYEVDDIVEDADIIGGVTQSGEYSGISALALLYPEQFAVCNLLAAPGWSHSPAVYNALVNATQKINGHWDAFALADLPLVDGSAQAVDTIEKAIAWKQDNAYNSERTKVFWPQAMNNLGNVYHLSTLAAVELMRADFSHNSVPMETCGNKAVPVIRQYFGANARNRGFDQQAGKELTQKGISTVVAWAGEWVLWGDHTAAYTYGAEVDPRAIFDVSMRMLMHITNSFQREWSPEIDEPMTRALKDRIINREQEKLDGYVSMGALLGTPTIVFLESENSTTDIMNGDFRWDIAATPTPPLKSASVYVAYTDAGFSVYYEEGGAA